MINKSLKIIALLFFSCLFTAAWAEQEESIKINCTLTDQVDGDKAVGEKASFTTTTPMIYLVCSSDEVKKGDSVKAAWIAIDTKNVAPANYQIAEKALPVDKELAKSESWKATYSISKPNKGWPVGQYKVDLYHGDELAGSFPFSIKAE